MRFTRLYLHTARLQELSDFYCRTLALGCQVKEDALTVKAGITDLVFQPGKEECYYHFAFNIASNKIHACLKWLSLRSEVIPHEGHSIVHFEDWSADAVYTLDPGGNIIEFIARKDMPSSHTVGFDPKQDVLSISEIGCPVEDISDFKEAIAPAHVPVYSGGLRYFCALGDPEGLFIVVDGGKKTWMPTEIEAKACPFSLNFMQGSQEYDIAFGDRITVSPI